jgi:hypothetical protein
MYDRYARRFEAKLERLGTSFARRVETYKRAVAAVQPLWQRVPRRQVLCRYQPGRRALRERPELQPSRIRCPLGGDGSSGNAASAGHMAACAAVYAHRLFDCPWQYQPNSTFTDELCASTSASNERSREVLRSLTSVGRRRSHCAVDRGCWRPSSGVK